MKVKIERMDHNGRGISYIDGKIVFIPKVLIDEEVYIKVIKEKKNYYEGEVIDIEKKSPIRIEPICEYFEICGGCDLMHMNYSNQLEYKENMVKDIMLKYANLNCVSKIEKGTDIYNYRNKTTFQVDNKIGLYKKNSNEVVSISKCDISDKKINSIFKLLNEKVSNFKNINQVIIKSSKHKNQTMVIFDLKEKEENQYKFLTSIVDTIIIKIGKKYQTIHGSGYIIDEIGEYEYLISPSSFFQINTNQAKNLYDKIVELANFNGSEKVLDLYCGTGTIGIYISKYVNKILGVEINQDAIDDAIKNKELNKINNIDFICSDVEKYVEKNDFKADVIVLDPPRSGIDSNTVNFLLEELPTKIVYVSCNPLTLARDLRLLNEKYNVKEIIPVDMFLHTYHVECVSLLVYKEE